MALRDRIEGAVLGGKALLKSLDPLVDLIQAELDSVAPAVNDYVEVTGQSTTSATLEDVAGCSFSITTPASGRLMGWLAVECSTTGGSPSTGAWSIEFDGVDQNEIQRYLSGINDKGVIASAGRSGILAAGAYTVQARHRRVSGASTVDTDRAKLVAIFVAE